MDISEALAYTRPKRTLLYYICTAYIYTHTDTSKSTLLGSKCQSFENGHTKRRANFFIFSFLVYSVKPFTIMIIVLLLQLFVPRTAGPEFDSILYETNAILTGGEKR